MPIEATHQDTTEIPTRPTNYFLSDFKTRPLQMEHLPQDEINMVGIEPRLYQQTVFNTCTKQNTLTVLPTGMGKTIIALMMVVFRLRQYPNSKVLFLAPTKPLVDQHKRMFEKHISIDHSKLTLFTGHVRPNKRAELWETSKIIFSTPQGLENDLVAKRINLRDVSLLIFDEAHRATGEYAYVFLAKQYTKLSKYPRILALTASPGSEMDKILEVCENLQIDDVEVRTDKDPDVVPYIQDVKISWDYVIFPDSFKRVQKLLRNCYSKKIKGIVDLGYVSIKYPSKITRVELLRIQKRLHGEIASGTKDFEVLKSISLTAEAMKIQHAQELCETQGIASLAPYLNRLKEQAKTSTTRAVKNLVADPFFVEAKTLVDSLAKAGVEHPKIARLRRIIIERAIGSGLKTIVFNQYRDTAAHIVDELSTIPGCTPKLFVGQAKKRGIGMSQKEQRAMLDEFRAGEFNVLVATSVAEEGLDIPKVDLVVFYEPVPSAIRHIQRKGRTGRLDKGSVIIMVTKGTRDEAYRWSAQSKQRRMISVLERIKKTFHLRAHPEKKKPQVDLSSFISGDKGLAPQEPLPPPTIFVDDREKTTKIIRYLAEENFAVELKRLTAGDYMLSERVGVEYKTLSDFVDSILDGRLLSQLRALRLNYQRPILIIEGDGDIFSQRAIHPNCIRGMISTITVSYGIPIIWTKTQVETAAQLAMIAKREHDTQSKPFNPHNAKKSVTLAESQEYIVSAIPGIGPKLAIPLLEHFGSVQHMVNASMEEIAQVHKIGEAKAKSIALVLTEKYVGQNSLS